MRAKTLRRTGKRDKSPTGAGKKHATKRTRQVEKLSIERVIKIMNSELKKVMDRVKVAQGQLQAMLKDKTWVDEARKYAERQGKEMRKLLKGDVSKVKVFIERERKEIERFQKQLPSEVKKLRKFVDGQKRELEKLVKTLRKTNGIKVRGTATTKKTPSRSTTTEKTTTATTTPAQTTATESTTDTTST